jgi:hypothetical protein
VTDGIISLALTCFGVLLVALVPEFRAVFCAWLAVMRAAVAVLMPARQAKSARPYPDYAAPCLHRNAVPVESVLGDVLAKLCPDCDEQLDADFAPPLPGSGPIASMFPPKGGKAAAAACGVTMAQAAEGMQQLIRSMHGIPPAAIGAGHAAEPGHSASVYGGVVSYWAEGAGYPVTRSADGELTWDATAMGTVYIPHQILGSEEDGQL